MSEWISVGERLPKFHAAVRVKREGGNEEKAYYHSDRMSWLNFYGVKTSYFEDTKGEWLYDVTHWMPLPEPPKVI